MTEFREEPFFQDRYEATRCEARRRIDASTCAAVAERFSQRPEPGILFFVALSPLEQSMEECASTLRRDAGRVEAMSSLNQAAAEAIVQIGRPVEHQAGHPDLLPAAWTYALDICSVPNPLCSVPNPLPLSCAPLRSPILGMGSK